MQLLYFSPVKFLCLIVWVYSSLYIVQWLQFGAPVPPKYKSIIITISLFFGPMVLLVLSIGFAVSTIKKAAKSSFTDNIGIKGLIENAISNLRLSLATISKQQKSKIELVDSSGRSIKDIYHNSSKYKDHSILELTEQIIANSLQERASDILIDPKDEHYYTVRFRVDGVLRTIQHLDADKSRAVINSIKAISDMDIAEKRRPQDGSFIAKTEDKKTASFRVASAGVRNGEKLSIRVLGSNAGLFTLAKTGLSEKQIKTIKDIIAKPSGMILMCGPTGSGKTTSLYAMLNEIDLFTRNVITVEDPVEYTLQNASQIEVNPKADITFAKALRSILRQDPDVICVGEIRDEETASIALRAAQTGHLVLATIHCNSNAASLVRLLDLGISPALMSSGLEVIISQRLLRSLCDKCKEPAKLSQSQIHEFIKNKINYSNICQAKGCENCDGTGYYDRTAIFDILVLDTELKNSIAHSDLTINELKKNGDKKGRSNLYKQGLKKVVSGITTFDELKRVIG